MRSVFIDELNRGGLPLLSEMVLETSGFEVTTVLKLIADPDNLPTAMFCTAGTLGTYPPTSMNKIIA